MRIRRIAALLTLAIALLVQHLALGDTVSIVTYSDDSSVLLEPTPISEAATIIDAIENLTPGGSTNLEGGLLTGYEQAHAAFRPDGTNVVVLASDGVANVGLTDGGALAQKIEQAGEDDIHLVTVGYGMGNYNDTLMEQLADQGDGFYAYIDTFDEAERLFVEELTPTLTPIVGDAKAQTTFDPAAVSEYRLIGYENRAIADEDFRDDTVDAGELGAGHTVVALYEVRLADPEATELGAVSLRWSSKSNGQIVEITEPILLSEDNVGGDGFERARITATLAELLRDEPVVVDRGVSLESLAEAATGVEGADEIETLIDHAVEGQVTPSQPTEDN